MLVEENLGRLICRRAFPDEEGTETVLRGFIYLVPTRQLVPVAIGDREKHEVIQAMAQIRRMISQEAMPAPTPVRARCVGCEFRNYCGDIW
jgi:CRISPR-associated exonuclease Cas4